MVDLIHGLRAEDVRANLERVRDEITAVGRDPAELPAFIDRCPVDVVGLMTMPPQTEDAESSRPHFAALRSLAERHGLAELSMGTSQDYRVAVQEGASIIRLGFGLYRAPSR